MERSRFATGLALLLVIVVSYLPPPVRSETIVIPIADLRGDLPAAPTNDPAAALNHFLAKIIQEQLQQLGLQSGTDAMFAELPLEATTEDITSFCPVPLPKTAHTDATIATVLIDDSSQFSFQLENLQDITIAGHLSGQIIAKTDAWVRWGQAVPFVGNCQGFTTDHGSIEVSMAFTLDLTLTLSLKPSFDATLVAIVVDKQAQLTGNLSVQGGNIQPDFGGISLTNVILNAFEGQLLKKIRNNGSNHFARNILTINNRLQGLDAEGNMDPSITPFNAQSIFVLEQDPQAQAVIRDMLTQLGIPDLVIQMLNERGIDILLTLATMDSEARQAYIKALGVNIGCEALRQNYARDLLQTPLYILEGNACLIADLNGVDQTNYYHDDQCQQAAAFRPTSTEQFCNNWVSDQNSAVIGNAAAWQADLNQPNDPLPAFASQKWTSWLSTRMDVGVVPLDNNQQPFVKLVNYKTIKNIPRGNGECALEMQIYKNDINAQNLQPLLAIHGGTWKGRGFSVFGLQASLSHFTQQGFIVFAPFYRLVDTGDANPECNAATWHEVTEDIEDALQWVFYYGERFGAISTNQLSVFGQSAGAHLATWLVTHRPTTIRKALLFYPPLDVLDFIAGAAPIDGPYAAFREFGAKSLAKLFGAQGGNAELRLTDIDVSRIDPSLAIADIVSVLPDTLFNLAPLNLSDPPLYLRRCAANLGLDLTTISLTPTPPALQTCLQYDAAEFLVGNAFNHQLVDSTVPIFIVHGSDDTLVPYAQAIKACNAIDGQIRPLTITNEHTQYDCGQTSQVHILQGAEHALDLGLCFGDMCPAGPVESSLRQATLNTLQQAYQWLGEPVSLSTRSRSRQSINQTTTSKRTNGGSLDYWLMLMIIGLATHRLIRSRHRLSYKSSWPDASLPKCTESPFLQVGDGKCMGFSPLMRFALLLNIIDC